MGNKALISRTCSCHPGGMVKRLWLLFIAIDALGLSGCATSEIEAKSRSVCAGLGNVPSGWVVIGRTREQACGSGDMNAWIIKQPGTRETVCRFSPIPPGYSIVGVTRIQSCSDTLDNANMIER